MKRSTKAFFAFTLVLMLFTCLSTLVFASENEEILVYDTSKYNSGDTVELNVYSWGEYISDGSEGTLDSVEEFEKYCRKKFGINVKVNYTTYDTNETMYNKINSSAVSYDIVIPSDYMIQKMAQEKLLLKFDASSIPNYKNIDDDFKNSYYDRENVYSVPYSYGMVGVIYNTEFVDPETEEDVGSWNLLWNSNYSGKILQFNNPRDAFASAMYKEFIDINSTEKADWDEALRLLKLQKPLLQAYVNDEIFNKMETGSAAIAPYYAGDFLTMRQNNESLAFYYPKEGTNYFVDAMCIPKSAKNPYLAMEYINFMLDVEEGNEESSAAIANALYIGYASPNRAVRDNEYYKNTLVSDDYYGELAMDILYGTNPILHNADYAEKIGKTGDELKEAPCYKSFSPESGIQEYSNLLWEELKKESSTELWVHITAGVIVGAVVALIVYSTYTKKKRSHHYRMRDKAKQ